MTTEDDFQAALDANPGDWQTRGVLGDFLTDRGDPRGPGYVALSRLRRVPAGGQFEWNRDDVWTNYLLGIDPSGLGQGAHVLPASWMNLIEGALHPSGGYLLKTPARRRAEDLAAIAWAELAENKQRAFLSVAERSR